MDRIAGLQDYKIYRIDCFGLTGAVWTGWQDYKIYRIDCFGLAGGCLDRMAGLQDLQDRLFWLSCGLTMDRMTGLQDLQGRLFWLNWGLFGQDCRITRFTA